MIVLDLCSGLGGMSAAFKERGHDVFTLDNVPEMNPTFCRNILELERDFFLHEIGHIDVVLAGPPCEAFSVASIGAHWTGGWRKYEPKTEKAKTCINIVQKCLDIIYYANPRFWMIENPRGVLRKLDVLSGLERRTVTYCQYGQTRMKPTDIWGGFPPSLVLKPMCKNGDPCHERAPRGAKTGTQGIKGYFNRSLFPYDLSMDICLACERDMETK